MSEQIDRRWEEHVQQLAADFVYPTTPSLSDSVARRLAKKSVVHQRPLRPLWAFLLIGALLFATAWGIPTVRAALLEWLDIGAVRIWLVDGPTPMPAVAPTASATTLSTGAPTAQIEDVTASAPMRLDFAGKTTLTEAQVQVEFPLLLPTYPSDLGMPDHVYLQHAEGDSVIFVWMQPWQPEHVQMSLHILGPGAFVWKMQPLELEEVEVNGDLAFWTEGPYYLQVVDSSGEAWGNRRLVDGHVLIWADGEMTYRLESALSLEEAIRVAESLGSE